MIPLEDVDRLSKVLEPTFAYHTARLAAHFHEVCESPIEVTLCTAVAVGGRLSASLPGPIYIANVTNLDDVLAFHSAFGQKPTILIPQYKWKDYRLDAAIFVSAVDRWVFIECDGHDFHERTKAQAAKDRSRDRDIQLSGIPILRFTGSEIYKDPAACAGQIIELIASFFKEKVDAFWRDR